MFAKEAAEITGIAKAQAIADLFDGQIELLQSRPCLMDQTLMNDGARAATLFTFAMRMQLGRPTEILTAEIIRYVFKIETAVGLYNGSQFVLPQRIGCADSDY